MQLLAFANISAYMNILCTSPVHIDDGHLKMGTRNEIAGLKEDTFSNLARMARHAPM